MINWMKSCLPFYTAQKKMHISSTRVLDLSYLEWESPLESWSAFPLE